MNSSMGCCRVC